MREVFLRRTLGTFAAHVSRYVVFIDNEEAT